MGVDRKSGLRQASVQLVRKQSWPDQAAHETMSSVDSINVPSQVVIFPLKPHALTAIRTVGSDLIAIVVVNAQMGSCLFVLFIPQTERIRLRRNMAAELSAPLKPLSSVWQLFAVLVAWNL